MSLSDIWDYMRASGDRRLRQQGYVTSGMGLLNRYRNVMRFWTPHLETNRQNILNLAEQLGPHTGGTLLILGAGRLLDIPWETLFPKFSRVVLADADSAIVPYVERMCAAAKNPVPKPEFSIGDLTASLVDTAAWAEQQIERASTARGVADTLKKGFAEAGTPQPPWARTYADLRCVISTNLMSQLGYFPRRHIQDVFRKRFKLEFAELVDAAEALECYFDRVRARHIHDVALQRNAWAYVSSDIEVVVYKLASVPPGFLTTYQLPPRAGVELDDKSRVKFAWPATVEEITYPLHKQNIRDLWPADAVLLPPKRWIWHIVPQGSEKIYQDTGRVHVVEAWTKRGANS